MDELAEALVEAQAQAKGSEQSMLSAEARAYTAEAACKKRVTPSQTKLLGSNRYLLIGVVPRWVSTCV